VAISKTKVRETEIKFRKVSQKRDTTEGNKEEETIKEQERTRKILIRKRKINKSLQGGHKISQAVTPNQHKSVCQRDIKKHCFNGLFC
jgi:hypothetical protein